MKIIQISPAYKPAYIYGGPTLSVALLCEALVKSYVNIEVFTTTANGANDFDSDEQIKMVDDVKVTYFRRLFRSNLHFSPSLLMTLASSTSRTDILHIHSWWNATAVLSTLIGVIRGNKIIISPRGMLTNYSLENGRSWYKKFFQKVIGRWLLNRCHLHVTTEKENRDVLKFINHRRITIIPNFAKNISDTNQGLKSYYVENPVIRLLFLSRIDKKKGLEMTFRALTDINFPWHLTIAGSGELAYVEYLQSFAGKLNLENRVSWIGFVDANQKTEIFNKHDLLILFSYNENFANVVVESLNAGLPVVISDSVGLSDFVIRYNLGWVTITHPKSIVTVLEQAYLDRAKRKEINRLAPKIMRTYFDENKIVKEYLQMYSRNEC
jgi:glycosyltransferase involved in cell wall biosynthesis